MPLPYWGIWVIVAVGCAIAEIFTSGFFIIWFSGGALVAAVLSLAGVNLNWQIVSFVAVSTVLVLSTKKISSAWFRKGGEVKTNVYALEGMTGYVIQDIPEQSFGQVKVEGEVWAAKSIDGTKIPSGAQVKVVKVEGVHLVVKSFE